MTDTQHNDKLERILDTAADLFARQPFHKVLLSDVARVASVGKGTLYLYFKSKEDLYFAVLFRVFTSLVDRIRDFLSTDAPADVQMTGVVRILTEHLFNKAISMELQGSVMSCPVTSEWHDKRVELWTLVEGVILRGIEQGLFKDEYPEVTAHYIPGMIRSVCLFKPEGAEVEMLCRHAASFVLQGLGLHR